MSLEPNPLASGPLAQVSAHDVDRARLGIKIILWCWVGMAAWLLILRMASAYSSQQMAEGNYDHALSGLMGAMWLFNTVANFLTSLAIVYGLYLQVRLAQSVSSGGVALTALGCYSLPAAVSTFSMVLEILQRAGVNIDWKTLEPIFKWEFVLILGAEVACLACLLILILRISRHLKSPSMVKPVTVTAVAILFLYGYLGLVRSQLLFELPLDSHRWLHFILVTAFSLGLAGTLAWLLAAHAKNLKASVGRGENVDSSRTIVRLQVPKAVHEGLATYRTALLIRLMILVTGAILIFLFSLGKQINAVKPMMVVVALASLAAEIVMLTGLSRYCNLPDRTRARGPAVAAFSLMITSLVGGLLSLLLSFMLFSENISTLEAVSKLAPYLDGAVQVIALAALSCLLVSFSRLGRALDLPEVESRVGSVGALIGIVTVLAILLRLALIKGWIESLASLIAFALLTLVLAVVVLVLYLGLIKKLIEALKTPSPSADPEYEI